jgi:hypothetical protein
MSTQRTRHLVCVRVNIKGLIDVAEKDDKLWLESVELDYVGLAK